jgi:hypothetical protein
MDQSASQIVGRHMESHTLTRPDCILALARHFEKSRPKSVISRLRSNAMLAETRTLLSCSGKWGEKNPERCEHSFTTQKLTRRSNDETVSKQMSE